MKRTDASLLFFLACLASCVPACSFPPPLAIERTSEQPQVRVTVELPASEDSTSWDRKGAEELAKALQQTGQFEVATVVVPTSSAVASLPQVRQVQGILRELGYDPGPIDDLMRKNAREALRQFQHAHNLPETGQIDAATKAVLRKPATKAATQSKPPPAAASPSEAAY